MKDAKREISMEEIVSLLNRMNLRVTPQRIIITKIILENVKQHPSFKQIYEMVRKELPSIGISTLFNTLKILEKNHVIALFELGGETHIDLPHPHVNIYCKNTGQIIDLEDEEVEKEVEKLVNFVAEKRNIRPFRTNIVIEAVCNGLQIN